MGGLCGVSQKQGDTEVPQRTRQRPSNTTPSSTTGINNQNNEQNKPDDKNTEKFQDMEEYKDGRMIGEGVKQIPSYKCTLPFDQLEKLREEFWLSKKNQRIWLVLKTCCQTDALSAKEILSADDLQCIGSNMRCVININNPDILYNVPNFCICDPVHEKDFSEFVKAEDQIKEKSFQIIICYVFNNSETKLNVSNKTTGKELKEMYAKNENISLEKFRLRILYKGQEIKDDHALFYHKAEENCRMQISIAEI